jgi:cephalosporin-C deacetylase
MYDPLHTREAQIFERLGYIDIKNIAKRIQADGLWGLALMDTLCSPSSQFAVYNAIRAKKEMILYPDFGHDGWYPGFPDAAMMFLTRPWHT